MAERSVYKGIMQGLQDAVDHKKGDKTKARVRMRTKVTSVPVLIYKPEDVINIRKNLNLSQKGLAIAIGVSPRTVESWEAGKSTPSGAATKILHLINNDNSLLDKLVIHN